MKSFLRLAALIIGLIIVVVQSVGAVTITNGLIHLWHMDEAIGTTDRLKKVHGDEHAETAIAVNKLTEVLRLQRRFSDAEPLNRGAVESLRKSAAAQPELLEEAILLLADTLYRQEKFPEAEPLYRELLESRPARPPAESGEVMSAKANLARVLSDWAWSERRSELEIPNTKPNITARAREAERLLRESLAIELPGAEAEHWRMDERRSRLGSALVSVAATDPALTNHARLAILAEAEPLLLEGYEAMKRSEGSESKYERDCLIRIVRLYEAWNKPDKAAEWQKKLDEFDKAVTEQAGGNDDGSTEH